MIKLFLKNFLMLFAIACFCFVIGCGEKEDEKTPEEPDVPTVEEPTPDQPGDPTVPEEPTPEDPTKPVEPTPEEPTPEEPKDPSIELIGDDELYINEKKQFEVVLKNIEGAVEWVSSNDAICTVDQEGNVCGIAEGECVITAKIGDVKNEVTVKVEKDTVAPKIKNLGTGLRVTVNWNADYDLLTDLQATDNIDGDITDKIMVTSEFDKKKYGAQTVTYSVEDSSGNVATFKKYITVKWNYAVQFIGHAGSYYGLMNSEEAILYAVDTLGYQLVEADLKQTSDGVFVMCHDDTFGGYTLASTPWSVLKDVTVTQGRSAGIPGQNGSVVKDKYTAGLCTLQRYLEICKQYNAKAVIELKYSPGITNNDQSRMQALMDEINKAGMLSNVVFLASQYNCLIWTRQNGYSFIPCQYLVNSCESDTYLKRCIDYDLDISINVTGGHSNSEEWLAKYKEAGREISTYTYTQYVDYPEVQKWIDKGVDYLTCDWQLMDKFNLPEKEDPNAPSYKVTFKDEDGTVLKEGTVKEGKTAAAPSDPKKVGYEFKGWDKPLKNIKEDTVFTAQYELINYIISYDANLNNVTEETWASKDEFVNEFYSDFFNWIKENESKISGLTKSGNKYTLSKNGVTVSFASADEMKTIEIYSYEKTLSNLIYKPVERQSDGSCVIYPDENYFLNSEKYLEKYRALDNWFYNCCVNNYAAYDRTFKPLSDGRIQIMFRFQQWCQGTSISSFNKLPVKYQVNAGSSDSVVLPTAPLTYTILDEIVLPEATCAGKKFVGWSLSKDSKEVVTKIEKGRTGNIILYAVWE